LYFMLAHSGLLPNKWPLSKLYMSREFSGQEIVEGLYVGDYRAALEVANGNANSITAVVSAYLPVIDFPEDIEVIVVPAIDHPSFNIEDYFERVSEFITSHLSRQHKVLVYSKSGHSRAPTLAAAFLISRGSSYISAMDKLSFMWETSINKGFHLKLQMWEKKIKKATKENEVLLKKMKQLNWPLDGTKTRNSVVKKMSKKIPVIK